MCTFVSPALWLLVVNFWTHLYRGHSSPGTHPEPSSLHPPAPSQCCVKSAPDEAAVSLQTVAGGRKTEGTCENCAWEHSQCRIQAMQHWKSNWFWRTRFTPINVFIMSNFVKFHLKHIKISSCLWSEFTSGLIFFPCCTDLQKQFLFTFLTTQITQKSIQLVFCLLSVCCVYDAVLILHHEMRSYIQSFSVSFIVLFCGLFQQFTRLTDISRSHKATIYAYRNSWIYIIISEDYGNLNHFTLNVVLVTAGLVFE